MTEKLKTRKYLLLGTLALLTLLLIILISFLSAYSSMQPVVITPASYPVSYNEPDDTAIDPVTDPCVKEFNNKNFPNFHFDYDSCYWSLKTEASKENTQNKIKFPLQFDITLTNNSGNKFVILIQTPILFGQEGGILCSPYDATPINDTFSRYNLTNEDYSYATGKIYYKGTPEFNDLEQYPTEKKYIKNANTKFCLTPSYPITFKSKYSGNDLGQGDQLSKPDAKLPTLVSIDLDIRSNSTTKRHADDVVRSITYASYL